MIDHDEPPIDGVVSYIDYGSTSSGSDVGVRRDGDVEARVIPLGAGVESLRDEAALS